MPQRTCLECNYVHEFHHKSQVTPYFSSQCSAKYLTGSELRAQQDRNQSGKGKTKKKNDGNGPAKGKGGGKTNSSTSQVPPNLKFRASPVIWRYLVRRWVSLWRPALQSGTGQGAGESRGWWFARGAHAPPVARRAQGPLRHFR